MAETLFVKILRIDPEQSDIPLPSYATDGSAGMDICAAIKRDIEIHPVEILLIPSGFVIELPQGYEAQIRPRSGLALKHNIGLLTRRVPYSDYRAN